MTLSGGASFSRGVVSMGDEAIGAAIADKGTVTASSIVVPNGTAIFAAGSDMTARRSIERILDAAVEELSQGSAMGAVAERAGVARATVYAHFPTREALIEAVTERAIADCIETIRAAEPDRGDPAEALARVLSAAWRALGRYHGLVAITTSRLDPGSQHALHEPVLSVMRALVERGQASGAFNPDVPTDWLLTVLLELVHTASREMTRGQLSAKKAEQALLATALGAVSSAPRDRPPGP